MRDFHYVHGAPDRGGRKVVMDRPTRPMSPCMSICTLDEDKVCIGCRRTLEEIRGWALMTPAEQWALTEELRERQKLKSKY